MTQQSKPFISVFSDVIISLVMCAAAVCVCVCVCVFYFTICVLKVDDAKGLIKGSLCVS